jgi:branched-subunit amino acid ABC-type transport system permease component
VKEFLQLAIAGAATGSDLFADGGGLTLSYSATGIFNLAYGAIAFCAALLYYELNTGLGGRSCRRSWPWCWSSARCWVCC